MVGVNGTGKTTTVGKLARVLVAEDRTVLLGAADTFRAAAADQLTTWGERVGAPVVRGPEGGDPASVAFDAVQQGADGGYDVVLVDTAGRLQNKAGLMDELGKVKRVVEKHGPVDEVLLVLDATTGQNGLVQARVFAEVVDVTGIVLTKLDGTAKGGIVVAVQRELGVPVKLVGLGEGPDDLAPFEPEAFVDALLGEPVGIDSRPRRGTDGAMAANPKEPSEVDRLLAEVDGMLGDKPRRSVQPHGSAEPATRPLVGRVRTALHGRGGGRRRRSGCCSPCCRSCAPAPAASAPSSPPSSPSCSLPRRR